MLSHVDGEALPLEQIAEAARTLGRFNVTLQPRCLTVHCLDPDGVSVRLEVDRNGCIAWLGGLVQEFPSTRLAGLWAMRVLTGECRLRIEWRGRTAYDFTLQVRSPDGGWMDALSSRYVRISPDWLVGKPRIEFRSNGDPSARVG